MMRLSLSVALIVVIGLAGCHTGPRAERYPPARSPAGATVTLKIPDRSEYDYELLAVEPAHVVVRALHAKWILRVELAAIESMTYEGTTFHVARRMPGQSDLERLRVRSRFPQGISDDLMRDLLDAYGVDEVTEVIRRRSS